LSFKSRASAEKFQGRKIENLYRTIGKIAKGVGRTFNFPGGEGSNGKKTEK